MPTAQHQSSSSTSNKPRGVDNKIANAAAKVVAQQQSRGPTPPNEQSSSSGQQTSSGNKTPQEQPEFIKQSLIIIEKKVRNLEKRRGKLEEYREIQAKGTPLNEDQLSAISRYDEVIRTLELSRELEKQFIGLANDAMKQQKKQSKKEQMEREEAIRDKLKESQKVLTLLNTFGDETIRNDFLNETNGAIKITEQEMNALDEYNKLVQPMEVLNSKTESAAIESADHIYNLIEGKNKQITALSVEIVGATFTYSDLKKVFDRIMNSTYWNRSEEEKNAIAQQQLSDRKEAPELSATAVDPSLDTNLTEQINNLNMNIEHHSHINQQSENHSNIPLEKVYHQQNTSDDYVVVSPSDDYIDSQNKQQQANTKTTFFSTLNPQEAPNRNINEFLNRCDDDGINFLQDSEIQSASHHEQQQQQHHHHHHQQQSSEHHQSEQHESEHFQTDHNAQKLQNFSNYQDFAPKEALNENRSAPKQLRDYNSGGSRNYQPRPRYQDDQRPPPRDQRGAMGSRGNNGVLNQPPRNNGNDRNGSSSYRGGSSRGGNSSGNTGGGQFRSGGYPQSSNGPRGGGGGGGAPSSGPRYPPRNPDSRQQVAQN